MAKLFIYFNVLFASNEQIQNNKINPRDARYVVISVGISVSIRKTGPILTANVYFHNIVVCMCLGREGEELALWCLL